MKSKLVHADGQRTYVVVLDSGDEAVSCLTTFAERENVTAASLTAIGAFSRACLGYFDRTTTSYEEIRVDEQVEVLSLVGDIGVADDGVMIHAHAVVGCRDGSTRGGHLLEGSVWPTLEVVVTETPAHLHRKKDPATGLALIDLTASP